MSRWVTTLCLGFLVGLPLSADAQWPGFVDRSTELGTATFSFGGTRPEMINTNENYYDGDFGDFDGDGLPDRVLGARYGLLKNSGEGVMVPYAGYTGYLVLGLPGASWGEDVFQWVDVDGDGDLDSFSGGNGEPLALQINEAGRFRTAQQWTVSALQVVNIDLENDGDVDLAVCHSFCSDALCGHGCPEADCGGSGDWPKDFRLMVNDGNGAFTPVSSTSRGLPGAEQLIMALASGDVNGDGYADLVFLNGLDRRFNVAINDGTGSFATSSIDFGVPVRDIGPISSGFHQGVTLGDIDGDDDLDIVAALERDIGTHPQVGHALFVNDGTGSFAETSETAFDVGTSTRFLRGGNGKAFDVDYDGDLDFVAFDRRTGRLEVFFNDGSGRLVYREDLSLELTEGQPALGNDTDVVDIDRDGDYDIWVGSGGADPRILVNPYVSADGQPADLPRSLQLTSATETRATISWRAPAFAASARYYKVYRATAPGLDDTDRRMIRVIGNPFQDESYSAPITRSSAGATSLGPDVAIDPITGAISFTDTSVRPGITYYYTVAHVGPENMESVQTRELVVDIPGTAPSDVGPEIHIVTPTTEDWSRHPRIVVHYADGDGVDPSSVIARFDRALSGTASRAAGANIVDLAYRRDSGVLILPIPPNLALPLNQLVTLTVEVSDRAGNVSSADRQFFVSVSSPTPPTASFAATPTSGTAPLEVAFDASASADADGKLFGWEWYFGDGSTGLGRVARHVFRAGGDYEVMLRVRDNDGGVATVRRTISVSGPGPQCTEGDSRPCYDGPSGTAGVGACREGMESCLGGAFATCGGAVVPVAEECDNLTDDDCDGLVDEGDTGACVPGGVDAGTSGGGGDAGAGGVADAGAMDVDASVEDTESTSGDSGPLSDGALVPPGSDGCSCRAAGGAPAHGPLWLAAAWLVLLFIRQRTWR